MPLATARHLAAIRKMAGVRPTRTRKTVPRAPYPRLVERDYAEELKEVTSRAIRVSLAPLLRALPELLDSAKRSRVDTVENRMDAGEGRRARELVAQARRRIEQLIPMNRLESLGRKFAEQTSTVQRMGFRRQVRSVLGIDLTLGDRGMRARIENFTSENVALIESLGRRLHDSVEQIVTRAVVEGRLHGDVAAEIEGRFGVTERHAELIARDQIGKLYGQINADRQQSLGVTQFVWRTVGDERVREEHQALEGQTFSYADPPSEGLPGTPIQCRCSAEPVLADLLGI